MVKDLKKYVFLMFFSLAIICAISLKIYLSNCESEAKIINVPTIEDRDGGEDGVLLG